MYSVLHTLSRFMTTPVLLEQIERVQKKNTVDGSIPS